MSGGFGLPVLNLQQALGGLGEAYEKGQKQAALGRLGEMLKLGDYTGAASTAIDAGDVNTGLSLLKLGQANQQTRDANTELGKLGALYGGGADAGGVPQASQQQPQAQGLGNLGQPAPTPSFVGGPAAMTMPGSGGATETKFASALRDGGLTNPNGLGAMVAYAGRESGFKGSNINGSWSDPSESGQPGTSGGVLSWRGDRFANMRRLTAGASDPVVAQAKFALTENPDLTMALQNAKSPEEANRLMANAWRFAGYNRQGGEFDARLGSTRQYVAALGGGGPAGGSSGDVPPMGGAQVASAPAGVSDRAAQGQVAGGDEADVPAAGAIPAQFQIPPGQREAVSAQAPDALQQAGIPAPLATGIGAAAPASQTRIRALMRLAAMPGLNDGQSKLVSTLLSNELEQTKMPDQVKQFMFARTPQGGGFGGTYSDWVNKKGDDGEKIASQIKAREADVLARGLNPADPDVLRYIQTGGYADAKIVKPGDALVGSNGREQYRNTSAPSMDDQTANFLAERVLAGDSRALIGLGRGAQGAENLSRIQGLVAQKAQERGVDASDVLHNVAVAQGMGAEQRSLGTSSGRMAAAAYEAQGAIQLGLEASAKVSRTSFVPLNRAIQMVQANAGSPELKQFVAANNTIINTFARAISPTGSPTVSDKEHAREMLSTADGPEAYAAVLQQMQREIDMAHKAPTQARTGLERERQAAKPGAKPAFDLQALEAEARSRGLIR